MPYPVRKYPRMKNFDYHAGGTFCVTICSKNKQKIFGTVVDGDEACVHLSPLGQLVQETVLCIPSAYTGVKLLNYTVMPNHIHLLLQIPHENPTSLFTIVRSTKSIVTRHAGQTIWQGSFYEHVVRNEQDALRFWKYIDENPKKWTLDPYFE